MTVRIDGKSLTVEDVIHVCRDYEKVEITEDVRSHSRIQPSCRRTSS